MWGKDNRPFPFLFYFFPPWGRLLTQLHTPTSPEAFIWDTTNVHACFCLQAFLTLARDIKAKMDKKLVRVKTVRRSLLAVGENFRFCHFLKTGNSSSVYFRRATTLRAATRESRFQSSPRRAASSAARFCEKDGSADIHHRLNCVPHWTELDRAHSDACFILPPSSSFFWFILWLIR